MPWGGGARTATHHASRLGVLRARVLQPPQAQLRTRGRRRVLVAPGRRLGRAHLPQQRRRRGRVLELVDELRHPRHDRRQAGPGGAAHHGRAADVVAAAAALLAVLAVLVVVLLAVLVLPVLAGRRERHAPDRDSVRVGHVGEARVVHPRGHAHVGREAAVGVRAHEPRPKLDRRPARVRRAVRAGDDDGQVRRHARRGLRRGRRDGVQARQQAAVDPGEVVRGRGQGLQAADKVDGGGRGHRGCACELGVREKACWQVCGIPSA